MTLFKSAPQRPSLPSPPDERLILLKALCSLFATLIPKIPSVTSPNTNTHGPFNSSDSGKNEKGRKLGQNSLIIAGQALGFGDRFRTGTSNEIIMAERIKQQISSGNTRTGSAAWNSTPCFQGALPRGWITWMEKRAVTRDPGEQTG